MIAVFWATEAMPIAVTSLLPIVLFPALGVMRAEQISKSYFKDKIVLFFGGLIVAAALEAVKLQKRTALRVLMLFGAQPTQLLLGFMCSTGFSAARPLELAMRACRVMAAARSAINTVADGSGPIITRAGAADAPTPGCRVPC